MDFHLPDIRYDFLTTSAILFPTAHEQVLILGLAALNLHELIKLQNPPLAARVTLASLVENWYSWVVDTFLVVSRTTLLVSSTTCSSLAANTIGNLETGVVVFRLGSWGRRGGSMLSSRNWCTGGSRSVQRIDLLGESSIVLLRLLLQLRWLVGSRMSACRARRNVHKLIKGQDSGLAALPSFM